MTSSYVQSATLCYEWKLVYLYHFRASQMIKKKYAEMFQCNCNIHAKHIQTSRNIKDTTNKAMIDIK